MKKKISKEKINEILLRFLLAIIYAFIFVSICLGILSLELAIFQKLDFNFMEDWNKLTIIFSLAGLTVILLFPPVYFGIKASNKVYNFFWALIFPKKKIAFTGKDPGKRKYLSTLKSYQRKKK